MNVKSLRRQVNGSGTMRAQKMSISVTRRRKTWRKKKVSTWAESCRWRGVVMNAQALYYENSPLKRVLTAPAICSVSLNDAATYKAVVESHVCNVALFSQGAEVGWCATLLHEGKVEDV